jgi:hypothetical protein
VSETPLYPCECEHECHFAAERETHDSIERAHFYRGCYTHDTVEVETPFGTFIVCEECAETCLKDYTEQGTSEHPNHTLMEDHRAAWEQDRNW